MLTFVAGVFFGAAMLFGVLYINGNTDEGSVNSFRWNFSRCKVEQGEPVGGVTPPMKVGDDFKSGSFESESFVNPVGGVTPPMKRR